MTIAPPGQQPTPPPRRGGRRLGWTPGQPQIYHEWGMPADFSKRRLASESSVLPELDESHVKRPSLWRHPAFIVSIIVTVLAVGAGVTLLIIGMLTGGVPRVSNLAITGGDGAVRLTWEGPDAPYSLYAVEPDGTATDLSQSIRGGTEAWIPLHLGYTTESTCFVVRAAELADDEVTLNAGTLEEQAGQQACVADAAPAQPESTDDEEGADDEPAEEGAPDAEG